MKRGLLIILIAVGLGACQEDDRNLFDQSSDERAAAAIADLKADLVAPANGWLLRYQPVDGSGIYNVLLKFDENDKVAIQTDLSLNGGRFFDQTISYRIDNSMGLELIFETYSFFSFLFEQSQASFGAEFEFNFINKTPDNALVFNSKSDRSSPTRIVLTPAAEEDINLLGREVSENLTEFGSSMELRFVDEDLIFYLSRDNLNRHIAFTYVSSKSDPDQGKLLNFITGYWFESGKLVLGEPLSGSFNGVDYEISEIALNETSETTVNICIEPSTAPIYNGVVLNTSHEVVLTNNLFDIYGANFQQSSNFFFAPLNFIFDNELMSAGSRIREDIEGALEMHLYYDYDLGDEKLFGIGFVIENADQSITFALREFEPVLTENQLTFNFADSISFFGARETEANLDNIDVYLDLLTEEDKTFITRLADRVYEFYNPCTGWRFTFVAT